jgi:hypothetical protein
MSPLGSERKAERLVKRLRDVEVGGVEILMAEASGAGEAAPIRSWKRGELGWPW